jgi:hypothetical protein
MRYCLLLLLPFSLYFVNCAVTPSPPIAPTPATVSQLPSFLLPSTISSVTASPVSPLPPGSTPTLLPLSSELGRLRGNFLNLIADLEKNMPQADSEQFVVPTGTEMDMFASLMANIEAGNSLKATQLASRQDYELVRYIDQGDDQAQSFLLRELKPIRRGWGLYAVRLNPRNNIIIEAPHPLFDRGTPGLALALYRALDAKALLIAGAHRYANLGIAADVAHNPITIFHTLHLALTYSDNPIVLQIHGFSAAKHPNYPQVILNSNHGSSPAELNRLADALSAEGLEVGICVRQRWKDLCGRTNVQLSSMDQGVFIHIELVDSVRIKNKTWLNALTSSSLLSENSRDARESFK